MPPADNMPDFDKMSPEELMAWMESLAKRQGVTEGLTTAADMAIPEVDPSAAPLDEPGYVPSGLSGAKLEEWKKKEEQDRAARLAAVKTAPPPPVKPAAPAPQAAPPPPPPPAPAPAPAAAATPDFDKMSPEELMAWMESLAKRQGVTEGLTTAADMAIPEVDPSAAPLDEPGYVPSGLSGAKLEEWKKKEEQDRAARLAAAKAAPPAPKPAAAKPTPPPAAPKPAAAQPPPPPVSKPVPVAPAPQFELPSLEEDSGGTTELAPAAEEGGMAWLENLAVDTNTDFPTMDLSSLGAELESLTPQGASGGDDPMAWLESLAQSDEPSLPGLDAPPKPAAAPPPPPKAVPAAPVEDPFQTGANPMEWLETLAKRQGVSDEELTTGAGLDIPLPDAATPDQAPGYTDYTFEQSVPAEASLPGLGAAQKIDPSQLDDPEAWLDRLATGAFNTEEPAPAPKSEGDVISALNQGKDISPEDMQAWMEKQFDIAAERDDVEEEAEVDSPLVKAELPDWLLDQMGTPPAIEQPPAPTPTPAPPTPAAPAVSEMPDWLSEQIPSTAAPTAPTPAPAASDMPDWLKEQLPAEVADQQPELEAAPAPMPMPDWLQEGSADEDIFAPADEGAEIQAVEALEQHDEKKSITEELAVDATDPWVEAFELERTQGMADISTIPDWYAERLGDAPHPAAAQLDSAPTTSEDITEIEPAPSLTAMPDLGLPPETELQPGQPEAIPDWLVQSPAAALVTEAQPIAAPPSGESAFADVPDWLKQQTMEEAPATTFSEELPDWLKEAQVVPEEVPDWLKETLSTDEHIAVIEKPAPAAAVVPVPTSPAPVAAAAKINVAAALSSARSKVSSGDVAGSLTDYEAVIRANAELDTVVVDLNKIIDDKAHKENPAVYRVLGDGLMRQGKLQAALDTYRKALNLL